MVFCVSFPLGDTDRDLFHGEVFGVGRISDVAAVKNLCLFVVFHCRMAPPRAGYLFLAHKGSGKPFLIKNAIASAFACSNGRPRSLRSVRIASISVI